jgi:hypothetical protein
MEFWKLGALLIFRAVNVSSYNSFKNYMVNSSADLFNKMEASTLSRNMNSADEIMKSTN